MRLSDCRIASADPVYHRGPSRCWAGTGVMYSLASPESRQFCEMWRSSECDLYLLRTQIFRYRAFTRFESTKSMSRYAPPKGTAGLARSAVSGYSRLPSPPARTMPSTCGCSLIRQTYRHPLTAARAIARLVHLLSDCPSRYLASLLRSRAPPTSVVSMRVAMM